MQLANIETHQMMRKEGLYNIIVPYYVCMDSYNASTEPNNASAASNLYTNNMRFRDALQHVSTHFCSLHMLTARSKGPEPIWPLDLFQELAILLLNTRS